MTEAAEQRTEQPTPRTKPRGPGKRFKKGQSGNPAGKKKPVPVPPGLVTRDGETQLEAMRWVLSRPTEETYLQWQMRQSLLADREKFLAAKVTLERAAAGSSSESPASAIPSSAGTAPSLTSTPDLGTERCLELARGLLEKYGVKP